MSRTRDDFLTALVHGLGFAIEVPFKGLSGKRRFRWDAALEARKVAFEYVGIGRGHQWASQQAKDHDKQNEAQLLGWLVIQCGAELVNNGKCWEHIEQAVRIREA